MTTGFYDRNTDNLEILVSMVEGVEVLLKWVCKMIENRKSWYRRMEESYMEW